MIKKLIEKWTCKHKWKVHYEVSVRDSGRDLPHTVRQTLICTECGKIKRIKL
jgi:hypothetical protein